MQREPRGHGEGLGRSKPGEWAVAPQESVRLYSRGMLAASETTCPLVSLPKTLHDNTLEVFVCLNACIGEVGVMGPAVSSA